MDAEWFYNKNNERVGPVTVEKLKDLLKTSEISENDLAWKIGTNDWIKIGSIAFSATSDKTNIIPPALPLTTNTNDLPPSNKIFEMPWSDSERNALSVKQITDLILVTLGAVALLVSIINPLLYYVTFQWLMIAMIRYYFFSPLSIIQRWISVNDTSPWIEFRKDGTFIDENGNSGNYKLLGNHSFIDFTTNGKVVNSWKILSNKITSRSRFPYKQTLHTINSNNDEIFYISNDPSEALSYRYKLIVGTWIQNDNQAVWIRFTKDKAVSYSNGSAGKYRLSGEDDNEIIEIKLTNAKSINYRLLSANETQLILSEKSKPITFFKHGIIKESNLFGFIASQLASEQSEKLNTNAVSTEKSLPPSGILNIESQNQAVEEWDKRNNSWLNYFVTRKKLCKTCKRRALNESSRKQVTDAERHLVTKDTFPYLDNKGNIDRSRRVPIQIYVDRWIDEVSYLCEACRNVSNVHETQEKEPR
jgi:hypothetical protein